MKKLINLVRKTTKNGKYYWYFHELEGESKRISESEAKEFIKENTQYHETTTQEKTELIYFFAIPEN